MTFDLPGGAAISSEDIFYNLSACVVFLIDEHICKGLISLF